MVGKEVGVDVGGRFVGAEVGIAVGVSDGFALGFSLDISDGLDLGLSVPYGLLGSIGIVAVNGARPSNINCASPVKRKYQSEAMSTICI